MVCTQMDLFVEAGFCRDCILGLFRGARPWTLLPKTLLDQSLSCLDPVSAIHAMMTGTVWCAGIAAECGAEPSFMRAAGLRSNFPKRLSSFRIHSFAMQSAFCRSHFVSMCKYSRIRLRQNSPWHQPCHESTVILAQLLMSGGYTVDNFANDSDPEFTVMADRIRERTWASRPGAAGPLRNLHFARASQDTGGCFSGRPVFPLIQAKTSSTML